jgi:hypothetical protein
MLGAMKFARSILEGLHLAPFLAANRDLTKMTPEGQVTCQDPAKLRVAIKIKNLEILRGCHL